jgi:hypothetical protein
LRHCCEGPLNSLKVKEIRCEHCSSWTDGYQDYCGHCGGKLHEKHLDEMEERQATELRIIPLIKINPDAPFYKKGFLHVVRFIQLIFLSIISVIAAMAGSTLH